MRAVFLMLALGACAVHQELNPDTFYKRDMSLTVNGFQGDGALVVPHAESYEMDIRAAGQLDLFTFSTCRREQTQEKAGEKGWFSDKNRRRLTYRPVPGLEAGAIACPVQLGGYEVKGRHSWALVDFEHPELQLPALVKCNGSQTNAKGVSVCQSKEGLLQEITFPEPVLAAQEGACLKLASKDGKTFRFPLPKGECTFRFVTKADPARYHRLTTLGYQQILIRE